MKVLLKTFNLNGNTTGFHAQNQKLEVPWMPLVTERVNITCCYSAANKTVNAKNNPGMLTVLWPISSEFPSFRYVTPARQYVMPWRTRRLIAAKKSHMSLVTIVIAGIFSAFTVILNFGLMWVDKVFLRLSVLPWCRERPQIVMCWLEWLGRLKCRATGLDASLSFL